MLVVPKLKELLDLKLVRFQHLELVDLGLQLVGDLEELDRSPIRRQQRTPLRRRTPSGDGERVFLAFGPFFIQVVQNRLVIFLLAVRQEVDQQRQQRHAADQRRQLLRQQHLSGIVGVVELAAIGQQEGEPLFRFLLQEPLDRRHVLGDLVGVGLEHVLDRVFDGLLRDRLEPLQAHVEVGEQHVVLQAVLVHDRREREGPHDGLRVVVQHPAPRLVGLFDLAPSDGRELRWPRLRPRW